MTPEKRAAFNKWFHDQMSTSFAFGLRTSESMTPAMQEEYLYVLGLCFMAFDAGVEAMRDDVAALEKRLAELTTDKQTSVGIDLRVDEATIAKMYGEPLGAHDFQQGKFECSICGHPKSAAIHNSEPERAGNR